MKWTDEEIDKLFQESAGKISFGYKPEYWEEFSASLPSPAPSADMTDEELDALFQESASQSSFAYKPEYWEEFSASLPVIVATEEVTDTEVDQLYRDSVASLAFKYNPSYWDEMAALLQRRRRPDFLWFGLSGLFATAIIFALFQQPDFNDLNPMNFASTSGANQVPLDQETSVSEKTNNASNAQGINDLVANNNATGNRPLNVNNGGTTATPNGNANNPIATNNGTSGNTPANGTNGTSATNPKSKNTIKSLQAIRPTMLANFEEKQRPLRMEKIVSMEPEPEMTRLETLEASMDAEIDNTFTPWTPGAKRSALYGVYVQGIGGISQSSITPSDYLSYSYGIGAGFTINKNNWTIGIGSNILVENYKDLHLTRTAKVYGFGSELYHFDLHYEKLYVAELDLSLGYNFGRHQIRGGIRPSYNFSSLVNIAETSVSSKDGEVSENTEQRTKVYGFMEGVHTFGLKPSIGYSYNFPSNWSIGVNISAELMPSIHEDFINGANNNLPFDGQLYIRKSFNLLK